MHKIIWNLDIRTFKAVACLWAAGSRQSILVAQQEGFYRVTGIGLRDHGEYDMLCDADIPCEWFRNCLLEHARQDRMVHAFASLPQSEEEVFAIFHLDAGYPLVDRYQALEGSTHWIF